MADEGLPMGPVLSIGGSRVLTGTCSWTDPTLVKDTDWYPRKSMSAAERLAFYAGRFPLVEVDSTYYFPPSPSTAGGWVERTPEGFTMNIKAWSLLTGHPTSPKSLWPDLQDAVKPEFRDKRNLYADHLDPAAVDEAWHRFAHALMPLHSAGKLGAVLLQYPEWFTPQKRSRSALVRARELLGDYTLCVEFRSARWMQGEEAARTLRFLEQERLAYVCVDEPQGFPSSVPPVLAATSGLAVLRFHGHNAENWKKRNISAAERFRYHYSDDELRDWAPKVRDLAEEANEVHLLMNNCWQDFGVDNAARLAQLLLESGAETISGGGAGGGDDRSST